MKKVSLIGRNQSKDVFFFMMKEELESCKVSEIKLIDNEGNETAPIRSELLNTIVGYDHDPETHNYNRAERRRIIKAAKKLEKQANKKDKK